MVDMGVADSHFDFLGDRFKRSRHWRRHPGWPDGGQSTSGVKWHQLRRIAPFVEEIGDRVAWSAGPGAKYHSTVTGIVWAMDLPSRSVARMISSVLPFLMPLMITLFFLPLSLAVATLVSLVSTA